MLKEVIKEIERVTELNAYPLQANRVEECIIYTISSSFDNGAVARHRLELRIITKTMAAAEEYRKKIISALVPIGDEQKIDGIYACQVNGGGLLIDNETDTIHTLVNFDLVIRSER